MIKRLTKVGLSLILVLMMMASMASIASAVDQQIEVQGKIARMGSVTPTPIPTSAPTPAPTSGTSGSSSTSSPKTGDSGANITLYAMAALLSMAMLVLLWRKRADPYDGTKALQGS